MTAPKGHLPSRYTTEGVGSSFHRVFYYAMGLTTEEIHQPHIGVVTSWDDTVAIHDEVRAIGDRIKERLWAHGLTPREFTTVPGFDGAGSAAAADPLLVSRELISDSCELTVRGHCYDALVAVGASCLSLAGLAMAGCRLDVPTVIVGHIDRSDVDGLAMAAALAELGLGADSVASGEPGSSRIRDTAIGASDALADRLARRERPRAGITQIALEQAASTLGVYGASSEPFLHLLALANEAGVTVSLRDLLRSADTAAAADATTRSSLLDGTPAGATPNKKRRYAYLEDGLAPAGSICIAPDGSTQVTGRARVFTSEDAACRHVDHSMTADDVIVLIGQGPRGGPGMRTCRRLIEACERATDRTVVVVTDGLAPGGDRTIVVACVTPEAVDGGPLRDVADGDQISIDVTSASLEWRSAGLAEPPGGTLAATDEIPPTLWKYVQLVGPASEGALTHPGATAENHCYADL